ncbi:hypothetical protein NRB_07580 [Novosphingobium sp. 11B]
MPHAIVKIATERSEADRQNLADRITQVVVDVFGHSPDEVSVAIEHYAPDTWIGEVYEPEIAGKKDTLYKRPGYGSLAETGE